ncbi:MAG: amino acid permease [Thermomicrobiales bacterium]
MDQANGRGQIGMFGAAFMGIGAMVGAGIFALLGEAGAIAGTAVWLSFLIAGAIALLQGYSFVKLGSRHPSQGGRIELLLEGLGIGHLGRTEPLLLVARKTCGVHSAEYALRLTTLQPPPSHH